MFEFLKNKLTSAKSVDLAALVKEGVKIVDVRSPDEFQEGHIQGAVNIPLQILSSRLSTLRKDQPVIVCCASGMRSSSAKRILEADGFAEVHNGGGWRQLQSLLG
ncbi:MAG TPA: rhodanese-like domain-containing protein [Fibrobacteria bacterium]|nr:rhodanese-like domain-containing protein [Fibrobacteria bacterium]